MFLFDLLFGNKKKVGTPAPAADTDAVAAPAAAATARAPGTRIHHDPELIVSLKEDHRLLLNTFHLIAAASRGGELMTAQTSLNQFRAMIQDHLLKENVRLYVYLEHLLQNDLTSHQMMHGFRHEMDGIGRAVVGFLDKYQKAGSQPELAEQFATDLRGIGEALVARIKREEDLLYPMYSAPV